MLFRFKVPRRNVSNRNTLNEILLPLRQQLREKCTQGNP